MSSHQTKPLPFFKSDERSSKPSGDSTHALTSGTETSSGAATTSEHPTKSDTTPDSSAGKSSEPESSTVRSDAPKPASVGLDTGVNAKNELLLASHKVLIESAILTPKTLYEQPNVAPKTLGLSTDYGPFISGTFDIKMAIPPDLDEIKFVTTTMHWYGTKIETSCGPLVHTPDHTLMYNKLPLMDIVAPPFADGIRRAMTIIDCNVPDCEIKVDPTNEEGVIGISPDNILSTISNILGQQFIYDVKNTTMKHWATCIKMLTIASKIGNWEYIAQTPTIDSSGLGEQIVDGIDTSEFINLCSTYSSQAGSLYIPNSRTYNPTTYDPFVSITGNLPNDDYVRYPRFEYSQYAFPKIWMKRHVASVLGKRSLPWGSQSYNTKIVRQCKVAEGVVLGSDPVILKFKQLAHRYIKANRVDFSAVVDLYNSMIPRLASFVAGSHNHLLYEVQFVQLKRDIDELSKYALSTFPCNDDYLYAFKLADYISPTTHRRVYSVLRDSIKTLLSKFDMNDIASAKEQIMSTPTVTSLPQANIMLSTLFGQVRPIDPERLAVKMAFDMMSIFNVMTPEVNATVIPSGVITLPFIMDYIGLKITFRLYPNTYLRNMNVWVSMVHEFLRTYFGEKYLSWFRVNGYGNINHPTAGLIIVTNISSQTRFNHQKLNYSLDSTNRTDNQLMNELMNALSPANMSSSAIPVMMDVRDSKYRIGRKFRVPGRPYLPTIEDNAVIDFPVRQEFNDIPRILRSFHTSVGAKYTTNSQNKAAENYLMDQIPGFINTWCSWFHTIYCSVYYTIAMSNPCLIHNDDIDPDVLLGWYDDIENVVRVGGVPVRHNSVYTPNREIPTQYFAETDTTRIFGYQSIYEAQFLYLTAKVPETSMVGLHPVPVNKIDVSRYQVFFTKDIALSNYEFYISELKYRKLTVEAHQYTSNFQFRRIFKDDVDWLNDVMSENARSGNLPAAGQAYLLSIFGFDTAADNKAYSYKTDLTRLLLADPRLYYPVGVHLKYLDNRLTPVVGTVLNHKDITKKHVLDILNLMASEIYGTNGMLPVKKGITISREYVRSPVTYSTRHLIPSMHIKIDPIVRTITSLGRQETYIWKSYKVFKMRSDGSVIREKVIKASDYESFLLIIKSDELWQDEFVRPPYFIFSHSKSYESFVHDEQYITNAMFAEYYNIYAKGDLMFVATDLNVTPAFALAEKSKTDDSVALSDTQILSIFARLRHTFTTYTLVDNSYSTGGVLTPFVRRNILPYDITDAALTSPLKIVASDLYDELPSTARAKFHVADWVVELDMGKFDDSPGVLINGKRHDQFTAAKYSRRSYVIVWYVAPIDKTIIYPRRLGLSP